MVLHVTPERGAPALATAARVRREWDTLRPRVAPGVYAMHDHACDWCATEADLTIEHIVPISLGGSNDITNLTVLCRSCNSSRGTRPYFLAMAQRLAALRLWERLADLAEWLADEGAQRVRHQAEERLLAWRLAA